MRPTSAVTSVFIANPGIRMVAENNVLGCFSEDQHIFLDYKTVEVRIVKRYSEIQLETLIMTTSGALDCPYLGVLLAFRGLVKEVHFDLIEIIYTVSLAQLDISVVYKVENSTEE